MKRRADWRADVTHAVLAAARISQAIVVEALDRGVGRPATPATRLLARVPLMPVAVGRLDVHAQATDDAYDLTIQLLRLHREFAQRLFEAIADPSVSPDARRDVATVVSLDTARERLSHSR